MREPETASPVLAVYTEDELLARWYERDLMYAHHVGIGRRFDEAMVQSVRASRAWEAGFVEPMHRAACYIRAMGWLPPVKPRHR